MMKQMRENTKIVLWVVVFAFVVTIFAVWGLDLQPSGGGGNTQQTAVGRINGKTITPQLYQSVYGQLAQQYRSNSPDGSLDYSTQELLRDQAWENIVTNALTEEQIEKLGITVTDEEVLSFLRDAPPAEVRQYFVDEAGNFDYAAYVAALNNPEADWTAVEQLARQRIPMIKLNRHLMAQVHVSREELTKAFEEENTRMVAKYVEFPIAAEDLGDYTPSDADIQKYYDENADDFSHDEKAVVRYVKIPIAPSDVDRSDIDFTIGVIRKQLEGDDFESLARTYSEAQTSQVGGDTGFITRGQRDAAIMDAVDTLEPGQISDPIWTKDGVHVVKLVETKEEGGEKRYRLSEIFLKLSAGSTTTDSLLTAAQEIQTAATAGNDADLKTAAAAAGLTEETTAPFAANVPIPGVGFVPAISRFAFAAEPGAVSSVLSDGNNYYVCELAERVPAGNRPLDEVRDDVKRAVLLDRRSQAAERKASAFRRSLGATADQTVESAAATYGYTVQTTDTFTVAEPVGGQPPRSPFAYAVFSMNVGDYSRPIESYGSYFIVQSLYRSPVDQTAFSTQAQTIRTRLLQDKAQQYMGYWFEKLRENSVIEDYRSSF